MSRRARPPVGDTLPSASLAELEAEARRRLRRRRWMIAATVVGSPLLLFAGLVMAAWAGAFDHLDREALRMGAWVEKVSVDSARKVWRAEDRLITDKAVTAPAALTQAVHGWVTQVNTMNGGALALLGVDGFGNAYLTFTAVYDTMSVNNQVQLLDKLGNYYRSYLGQVLGGLPVGGSFSPGIIIIDSLGLHAQNRNRKIEWCRPFNRPATLPDGSTPCRLTRIADSGKAPPR